MRFSVLLPTRNRLEYLRYAVETVRRQDFDDWEIIISDNFSEDDIAGYVGSLDDPRVKYFRTDRSVPVTENWNNALEKASGDYVVMLGDDDALLPGYFRRTLRMIEDFANPDLFYINAYVYAYPGVWPESPDGFLRSEGFATFLQSAEKPFLLDRRQATAVALEAFNFRMAYGYNMQFALVRREFIHSLSDRGPFYQSPFPDYYAMNVMFLKARTIVVCPDYLVAIGMSPKSYGYYHFNNLESKGVEFLGKTSGPDVERRLREVVLPGSNIYTSWLYSVETIRENYGRELGLKVNYNRYRLVQIYHAYRQCYVEGRLSEADLALLTRRLRMWERLVYGRALKVWLSGIHARIPRRIYEAVIWRIFPKKRQYLFSFDFIRDRIEMSDRRLSAYPVWAPEKIQGPYKNILDVFEEMSLSRVEEVGTV
jgi:glycosyltransferase involved in cell wall biosynthesis